VSKQILKPEQWMKTIGVGMMNPCDQKEGSRRLLVYNKKEACMLMEFLNTCARWGWSGGEHRMTGLNCGNRDRYAVWNRR